MTSQELNILFHNCELERTQLLTKLAMPVQNPQLANYFSIGDRSNYLYVESSTAWLYDCPKYLLPLHGADECFDCIPVYYQDTVMDIGPKRRQNFN